jgi:hypothetical protein
MSANLTLLGPNRLPAAPCFVELTISVSKDLLVATTQLVHRSGTEQQFGVILEQEDGSALLRRAL